MEQEDGGSHRGWNQTSEVHSVAAGEQKRLVMTESFIIHRDTCIVYLTQEKYSLCYPLSTTRPPQVLVHGLSGLVDAC